jgi:hypothetical protein
LTKATTTTAATAIGIKKTTVQTLTSNTTPWYQAPTFAEDKKARGLVLPSIPERY